MSEYYKKFDLINLLYTNDINNIIDTSLFLIDLFRTKVNAKITEKGIHDLKPQPLEVIMKNFKNEPLMQTSNQFTNSFIHTTTKEQFTLDKILYEDIQKIHLKYQISLSRLKFVFNQKADVICKKIQVNKYHQTGMFKNKICTLNVKGVSSYIKEIIHKNFNVILKPCVPQILFKFDWICLICHNLNFNQQTVCEKCNGPISHGVILI